MGLGQGLGPIASGGGGGAFMPLLPIGRDDFNRADASSLGTAPTGQTWSTLRGTFGIEGGKAKSLGSMTSAAAVIDCSAGNILAWADITLAAAQATGLCLRGVDGGNFLSVTLHPTEVAVRKRASGANASLVTAAGTYAPGTYRFAVSIRGDEIRAWVNGAPTIRHVLSGDDFALFATSVTKHGVFDALTDATSRIDNLVIVAA